MREVAKPLWCVCAVCGVCARARVCMRVLTGEGVVDGRDALLLADRRGLLRTQTRDTNFRGRPRSGGPAVQNLCVHVCGLRAACCAHVRVSISETGAMLCVCSLGCVWCVCVFCAVSVRRVRCRVLGISVAARHQVGQPIDQPDALVQCQLRPVRVDHVHGSAVPAHSRSISCVSASWTVCVSHRTCNSVITLACPQRTTPRDCTADGEGWYGGGGEAGDLPVVVQKHELHALQRVDLDLQPGIGAGNPRVLRSREICRGRHGQQAPSHAHLRFVRCFNRTGERVSADWQ